ncbi:phage tail tip lysozyme [Kribbella sp. CA-247076]|uniref:phage tail tip lysozyme n=1 Tax=Kribbella sp. CA-247076 TaxID=3239941 RepID=UPI003D8A6E3B
MGDSKALPIAGGVLLVLFLPLLIVIALILGGLAGMASAEACTPTQTEGKAFGWPTDRQEIDQGWSEGTGEGESPHRGIDFDVDAGSKVYAAEDGTVVSIADNQIRIRHDEGVETRYKYFENISVRVDQEVKRGDQIGTSGSGDEAAPGLTGEHLHFELWVQKDEGGELEAVDPDPDGDTFGEDTGETESGCGCSTLVGSNNQQKAFNYFTSNGYSKEQAAGIVGNMIHESGVEPGRLQNTPPGQVTNPADAIDSPLGWGIVQWTPAGKMIRPSRGAGVDDAVIGSLEYQLEFLKKQLDGETAIPEANAGQMLKRTNTAEDAAVAFGRYYERFAGSDDLSNPRYTQRKTAAREVLSTFGGAAPGEGGASCGAGNGDIVRTALQLAWDTPGHGHSPKPINPTYEQAVQEHNGSSGEDVLTDCGVFVATVMRMSGADPEYAVRGTSVQIDYLRSSGKYDILENLNNEGQLKPGDIFIIDGHTYLYTGNYEGGDGRTYNAASASLYGHVPEASHVYFSDYRGHYTVARLKQSGASADG